MKIAIVGAGIVGVTTAYELAQDGHEITVFDPRSAAAEEASFAPAGLLAPLLLSPWTLPGAAPAARLMGAEATLRVTTGATRQQLHWLWQWRKLMQQAPRPSAAAAERLARYSQDRLRRLAQLHQLDFEAHHGRLVLLRTSQHVKDVQPALQVLQDCGVPLQAVDADRAREIEPGLASTTALAGAIHLPDAGAGNCRVLGQLLRQGAQAAGVQFIFNTRVAALSDQPRGVVLQGGETLRFDATVLCAGHASSDLLATLGGAKLPITPVHGYTITTALRDEYQAPRASVVDAAQRVSITRLGQRIRIAGGAELTGSQDKHHQPTLEHLYKVLNDWFPGGASLSAAPQVWRGARGLTPDGAPLLGASGRQGVWLNTGHGAGGWALASGSARVLADLIDQREPEVSIDGLGLRSF